MARGRIEIDAERCKGCELCRGACTPNLIFPAKALNGKGYRPVLLVDDEGSCSGCALCAVVCPEACISVFRTRSIRRDMALAA